MAMRLKFVISCLTEFVLFFYLAFAVAVACQVIGEPITPLTVPQPNNLKEVMLGKQLFHDVRLSKNNTVSCASCHNIAEGGDDGLAVSVGINNQQGSINASTVMVLGY